MIELKRGIRKKRWGNNCCKLVFILCVSVICGSQQKYLKIIIYDTVDDFFELTTNGGCAECRTNRARLPQACRVTWLYSSVASPASRRRDRRHRPLLFESVYKTTARFEAFGEKLHDILSCIHTKHQQQNENDIF